MVDHNLHDDYKQTLVVILPEALNQFSDAGDASHLGVVKVGERGLMMVHELMRVTIKHINVLGG